MNIEDDTFGGGFAEVRDGEPVTIIIRPASAPPQSAR